MPDTNLQTSEASVTPSEAKDLSPSEALTESQANVILSEAKDLSPSEALTDVDTLELDLALEEELIIEDFTIDGICGVY
jgi:mycofactocin precursor